MLAVSILAATQIFAFAPGSKLWIEGDSNLHPWACQATAPEARIEVDKDAPEIARALSLKIQVSGLECGSGKMNEKLRDALNAEQHPTIEYQLTRAERISGEALQLKATGELTINGQTRTVAFLVDVVANPDGTADASGELVIKMSDYGVEPPTAMLGLLKTYDRITVKFEIRTAPRFPDAHASLN